MRQTKKKKFFQQKSYWLGAIIAGLVIGAAVQFVHAWSEPPVGITPPGGNVLGPVTMGDIIQYKTGKLGVSATGVDLNYGLTVGSSGIKATGNSYFEGKISLMSDGINAGELKVNYVPGAQAGYYATYAP